MKFKFFYLSATKGVKEARCFADTVERIYLILPRIYVIIFLRRNIRKKNE